MSKKRLKRPDFLFGGGGGGGGGGGDDDAVGTGPELEGKEVGGAVCILAPGGGGTFGMFSGVMVIFEAGVAGVGDKGVEIGGGIGWA